MKDSIDYKKLGNRIKEKRLECGLTQEEVANQINISPQYLSNIEANNVKSIGLKTLFAIANALNTSFDYLLSDSLESNSNLANKEIQKMLSDMTTQQRLFTMDSIKMILNNIDRFK